MFKPLVLLLALSCHFDATSAVVVPSASTTQTSHPTLVRRDGVATMTMGDISQYADYDVSKLMRGKRTY